MWLIEDIFYTIHNISICDYVQRFLKRKENVIYTYIKLICYGKTFKGE